MKKWFKILTIVLLVIFVGSFLVACGEDSTDEGTKYTLVVWAAEDDQALVKQMCDAYAAANPQNTYKFLYGVQAETDAADKVLNDVESGPDVFSFASDQINKLITGGALAQIGGSILDNITSVNSVSSMDAATVTVGGTDKVFAYPSTADNYYFLYYDKSKLTDDDVKTLDGILSKANATSSKFAMNITEGWYLSSFFFAFEDLQYEVTYSDTMTETAISINYDNATGLNVAKAMYNYVCNSAFSGNVDDAKIKAGFTDGTIAAAVSGTWNANDIKAILGDNMGVCKLPTYTVSGAQYQMSGFSGYKLMGVNGFSKNKGEAHKLAQWLTNEQNQLLRYNTRGFAPTNKVVANRDDVKSNPIINAGTTQSSFNRTQKGVPSTYWTPMQGLAQAMLAKTDGTLSVSDLQTQLTAMCNNIKKEAK